MCSAWLGVSRAGREQGMGTEEETGHPGDRERISKNQGGQSLWAPGKGKGEWRADVG